jgi:hypothetical protein
MSQQDNHNEDQIVKLKKEIRKLEIELDYIEAKEPHNIQYILKLERGINNLYEKLEELQNETK